MQPKLVVGWSLFGFIFVGLANGQLVCASTPPAAGPPIVRDVALHGQGTLRGLVVDAQGASLANVDVALVQRGEAVARVRSANDGSFAVSGLRGGVYQISTQGVVGNLRLWAPHTAPPVAEDEALVVHQAPVVYQAPPAAAAARGSKVWRIVTNPWVLGGVAAAAIIIPLSLDDHDDAS